jgi:hypothetical protein
VSEFCRVVVLPTGALDGARPGSRGSRAADWLRDRGGGILWGPLGALAPPTGVLEVLPLAELSMLEVLDTAALATRRVVSERHEARSFLMATIILMRSPTLLMPISLSANWSTSSRTEPEMSLARNRGS